MKRLLWAAIVVLGLISLWGCGTHSEEDAAIAAKNESRDNIELTISVGGVSHVTPLGPNANTSYVIEIPVARPPVRYRSYSGPSQVDRIADIQVSVFNREARESSRTRTCQAGAKVTTSIIYRNFPPFDRAGDIYCDLLDAYGNVVHPNDIDPSYAGVASKREGGGSQ